MSVAGSVRKLRLTSQVWSVRVDQCVSAVIAVEMPVFVCLGSVCSHVTDRMATRFVRLALRVDIQNCGDFVGVILLYLYFSSVPTRRVVGKHFT